MGKASTVFSLYTVSVPGKDKADNRLSPSSFTFKTEKINFTASISPAGHAESPPYKITHYLTITNLSKRRNTFLIDIVNVYRSPGWKGGYRLGKSQVNIPPKGTEIVKLTVSANKDAKPRSYLKVNI